MRPKERREAGEQDLFRARLDQIIDLDHALVRLARVIDWRFLEEKLGAVYTDEPGRPPLPTRLMAGLSILKHSYNLSDEALCERWVENPYFQHFCGEEFFQHRLVFDRSSLTRWRQRMGERKLQALLQESLAVATRTAAMKPSDLARVVVDTTVQPKAVMFPTDAKLFNRARERLVRLANRLGVELRQSYRRVGKLALIKHQRYAHAHQFKRANRSLRKLKTYLGRVIRDIGRRIAGDQALEEIFARELSLARRVPLPVVAAQMAAAAGKPPNPFVFRLGDMRTSTDTKSGTVQIADSTNFLVSKTVAATRVTIKPGGMRDMHWHPNADEWNYWIKGTGRVTVFNTGPAAMTANFHPGDIGYVKKALGHYVENTGDTDLVYMEVFRADRFEEVSLSDWLAHSPIDMVAETLNLDPSVIAQFPKN